jgi:hypothetical protein
MSAVPRDDQDERHIASFAKVPGVCRGCRVEMLPWQILARGRWAAERRPTVTGIGSRRANAMLRKASAHLAQAQRAGEPWRHGKW